LYETTFILGPQADEATFDRQINAVSDVIKRYNGKVFDEDRIGIRRLAYPIKKYTQGYYTRLIFTGDNNVLSELDRFYRLEEAYIRYLTVKFEGRLDEETGKVAAPMPKVRKRPETTGDDSGSTGNSRKADDSGSADNSRKADDSGDSGDSGDADDSSKNDSGDSDSGNDTDTGTKTDGDE
jgi:small subunit ribosomal protein S6